MPPKTTAKKTTTKKPAKKPVKRTTVSKKAAPKSAPKKLPYAGFWKRAAVLFTDKAIQNIIIVGPIILFYYLVMSPLPETTKILAVSVLNIVIVVLILTYIVVNMYLYFSKGKTIGDYVMGTKLIDAKTHKKPAIGKLLGRFFAKFLSVLGILGFAWAGWDKQKRAWHDSLSGIRYVETRSYFSGWTWLGNVVGIILPITLYIGVFITAYMFQGQQQQLQAQSFNMELIHEFATEGEVDELN